MMSICISKPQCEDQTLTFTIMNRTTHYFNIKSFQALYPIKKLYFVTKIISNIDANIDELLFYDRQSKSANWTFQKYTFTPYGIFKFGNAISRFGTRRVNDDVVP